jgi:opacity protein-like surface antigen
MAAYSALCKNVDAALASARTFGNPEPTRGRPWLKHRQARRRGDNRARVGWRLSLGSGGSFRANVPRAQQYGEPQSSTRAADNFGDGDSIAPVYNWTGFYVGLNAGGGFGRTNASETGLPDTGVFAIVASANYGLNHDLTGAFGGAQAGYTWQVQNWVWGVEADIQGADIRGRGTLTGAFVAQRDGAPALPGNFVTASEKIDYFGTTRLRAGFLATPALLVYGTGGLAWADVKTSG